MTPRLALGLILTVGLTIASVVVLIEDDPPTSDFVTADGESIFRTKGCVGCHTARGQVSQTNVGPNLNGLADRAGDRVDGLSAEDYVRQSILAPQIFVVSGYEQGVAMPALILSTSEVDALIDFLLEEG